MPYDVIIAGAGPGGAHLAARLAKANLDVLLVEKAELPRYKPCGGGVCFKALPMLAADFTGQIEDVVNSIVLTYRHDKPVHVQSPKPIVAMVMRDKFDYWLVQKAREAGANLLTGCKVNKVIIEDKGAKIYTDEGLLEGKVVVGADGVNSTVARELGLKGRKTYGLTLEGELEVPPEILKTYKGTIHLDFGCIPGGYGWVFCKEDHLSVGIGTFSPRVTNLKQYLQSFLSAKGLTGPVTTRQMQGYLIPSTKGKVEPLSVSRGLLVGDAAGVVDPFTGEGIYYALRSAELAAGAITAHFRQGAPLTVYDRAVAGEILKELRRAYKLGRLVYLFPGLTQKILAKNEELALKMCQILSGEKSYSDIRKKHLLKGLFKLLWC